MVTVLTVQVTLPDSLHVFSMNELVAPLPHNVHRSQVHVVIDPKTHEEHRRSETQSWKVGCKTPHIYSMKAVYQVRVLEWTFDKVNKKYI